AGACIRDFHGLLFLAAMGLVPLEHHVIFVGELYHFPNRHFHSGHHLDFARVRECLGRGIVRAIGKLDTGSHVIDPRANKFFLHVVVTLGTHAFELHVFHFPGFIGHLHFAGNIHHYETTSHNTLPARSAFGFLRFGVRVGIHPHLDRVIPAAVHVREQFVVLVQFPHLHHLFHHLLGIRLASCNSRLGRSRTCGGRRGCRRTLREGGGRDHCCEQNCG